MKNIIKIKETINPGNIRKRIFINATNNSDIAFSQESKVINRIGKKRLFLIIFLKTKVC